MRQHHTTTAVELVLKGWCYHCWDYRQWIHKLTTSHRIAVENRWVMDVGCLWMKIGWSHYIGGCYWVALG